MKNTIIAIIMGGLSDEPIRSKGKKVTSNYPFFSKEGLRIKNPLVQALSKLMTRNKEYRETYERIKKELE